MKIVACYKLVPDDQDIKILPDRTVSLDKAEWKISDYDLNAVEAGVALKEAAGGSVVVLTAGGTKVQDAKLRKGILARGADEMAAVCDERMAECDSCGTAEVLAAAVEKIGGVELVLCGEGSGDLYAQQTGVLLGQLLGWTTLNAMDSLWMEDGKLMGRRALEDETELVEIPLPAVLSVTTSINKPRVAGMREIMAAGKKPAVVWTAEDLGITPQSRLERISTLAPVSKERQNILLEDASEENIQALCDFIRKSI